MFLFCYNSDNTKYLVYIVKSICIEHALKIGIIEKGFSSDTSMCKEDLAQKDFSKNHAKSHHISFERFTHLIS